MRKYIVILLFLYATGLIAQTFTLNDTSTYPASRIWVNVGAQNYYNAYLTKNLIKVNPGMQPQLVRQVKTCSSGSVTTCVTTNDYDSMPLNYAVGWNVYVACHGGQGSAPGTCTGGAFGQSGTVTANTANGGSGSTLYTISGLTAALTANDSIWLVRPQTSPTLSSEFTWDDFGWEPMVSGTGTATIDTTSADLPATLAGFANPVQVIELKTTAGSSSAGILTYFDTTSGALNYTFSGSYHFCVNISVKSGTPGNLTGTVVRSGGGVNGSVTLTPTGGWNTYCGTFTGTETSATTAGTVQITLTMSPSAAADIVVNYMNVYADADNSATAYTNAFLSQLNTVNPGGLRYNSDGQEGTSMLNWITPVQYRQTSSVIGSYGGVESVQQGLHEFLTMAQAQGYKEVSISVPPTFSATDWANLTQYLGGTAATTYGGYRSSLGQATPWTSVFNSIVLEVGNETWNTTLNTGQSSYPQYSVGADAFWNYTKLAINACTAVKASASYSSVIKCAASTQTALGTQQGGYINTADTGNTIDLLSANEYGQFAVSSCGIPNQYTSAAVEAYANTLSGSSSGFYQTSSTATSGGRGVYVYEYNNSTNSGSCTQSQINGYPEGEYYGLVNTLMPLLNQKTLGITQQSIWQMYQPSQPLTTSGGATSINEWGIFTGPGGAFHNARGSALAMGVVNNAIGSATTGISVTTSGVTTFNFSAANGVNAVTNVPYLFASAYKNGTSRSLIVHNIDTANAYTFTVVGTNAPSGTITQTVYNSTNVNDSCEGANASACNFVSTSTVSAGTYTAPAHSIVTLTWSTAVAPTNVSVYGPSSTAGQPWFALPGFSYGPHWAQVYTDVATLGSWTIVSNVPTITAPNDFSISDFVQPQNFTLPGYTNLNERILYVSAATSSNFTLNGVNGSATGGTDTGAIVHKLNGVQTGTWTWTNTGSVPVSATITSLDGNRTNTGTAATLTGEQPFVNIVFNAAGVCSESGTSGSYSTTSTAMGNLVFTSDADPTKSATYPYVICAPGMNSGKAAVIYIRGATYMEVFKNDQVDLMADIWGNADQRVDWAITSSPSGGDGYLEYASYPEPIFHTGTVAGQYEFTAYWTADHSVSTTEVRYVANQTRAAANPDLTEQMPCEVDPAVGFTVYRVGAGETYPTPADVPGNALTGPALIQLINHGAAGSPETFHNYWQAFLPTSGGPFGPHKPAIVICGIPNATSGEYVVQDASNATGKSWTSIYTGAGATLFSVVNPSPNQVYTGSVLPLNNVTIANMHIQNASFGYSYTDQSGNPATWGDSSAVRFYNTENGTDIGLWTNNVAIPVFLDANSYNNVWGGGSFHIVHEGGNFNLSGSNGRSTEHPIYTQGLDDTIRKMLIQGEIAGAGGDICWSSRAFHLYAEYNRCVPAPAATGGAQMHGQGEIQNFLRYILASEPTGAAGSYSYFGAVGDTSCQSPYCNGDAFGPNGLAGLIALHRTSGMIFGNTFEITGGEKTYGTTNTNGVDTQIDGPQESQVYYNTYAINGATYFGHYKQGYTEETRISSPGSGTPDPRPVMWPRVIMGNNIFPWTSNTGCSNQSSQLCYTLTSQDTDFVAFSGKNLVASGQINYAPTITQGYNSGGFPTGLATDIVDTDYEIGTLNYRWGGFTLANFPSYTTYPLDTTSYAPITGSAAIGIASTLTGIQALYPPRWNSVSSTGVTTRRADLTTVGAQDPSSVASIRTFIFSGKSIAKGKVIIR